MSEYESALPHGFWLTNNHWAGGEKVWWCAVERQVYKRDVENACAESHKRRKCGWYFLIPLSASETEKSAIVALIDPELRGGIHPTPDEIDAEQDFDNPLIPPSNSEAEK